MGCWNQTCAVTNIPINGDTDVMGFFLESSEFFEADAYGTSYPDTLWSPVFIPFAGKYNDYGFMEDMDEKWFKRNITALKHINTQIVPDERDNESIEITTNNVFDLIHAGRLFTVNNLRHTDESYPRQKTVGFMMVHKRVYDHMSKEINSWAYNTPVTYMDIYNEGMELIEYWMKQKENKDEDQDEDDKFYSPKSLANIIRMGIPGKNDDWKTRNKFQSFCSVSSRSDKVSSIIIKMIEIFYKKGELDNIHEALKEVSKFMVFNSNMSTLRRQYFPPSGQGSQGTSYKQHIEIAQVAIDIMNDRIEYEKKWDVE